MPIKAFIVAAHRGHSLKLTRMSSVGCRGCETPSPKPNIHQINPTTCAPLLELDVMQGLKRQDEINLNLLAVTFIVVDAAWSESEPN